MKSRLLRLLAGALLCGSLGWADMIFEMPALSGSPGDILTFQGTLVNDWGYDAYLNSVTLTLAGFAPGDMDSGPFLIYAPLTLANGASEGPFDWFTVSIPAGFGAGTYDGWFSLLGGDTADADLVLDSAAFQVQVTDTSGVPEPSSLLLAATGLGGALLLGLRRRRAGRR